MNESRSIPTLYGEHFFRSQLEARWAVFFDALNLPWKYERQGYDLGGPGWYLPDFWLPRPSERYPLAGHWFEIKGQKPTDAEIAKVIALARQTKHTAFLMVGLPGTYYHFWAHNSGNHGWRDGDGDVGPAPFMPAHSLQVVMSRWNVKWPDLRAAREAAGSAVFRDTEENRNLAAAHFANKRAGHRRSAAMNTYATKKYGPDWRELYDDDRIFREFDEWIARKHGFEG